MLGRVGVCCALGMDALCGASTRRQPAFCSHLYRLDVSSAPTHRFVPKIPEELLKPSYLLLEPVRYTLAEIVRLCRRPMVLPGPLVKCMLQDLLGAVTICHDRNIVIKSLDAEKVGRTFRFERQQYIAACHAVPRCNFCQALSSCGTPTICNVTSKSAQFGKTFHNQPTVRD